MCTTALKKRKKHFVLSHLNINMSKLPGAEKKSAQSSVQCTFPFCPAKYCFPIQNNPAALGQDVNMLVQKTGDMQHKLSDKKGTPATNLTPVTQSAFLQHAQNQTSNSWLGTWHNVSIKKELKVIGSEIRKKESIQSDIMIELYLMQTIIKECATKFGMFILTVNRSIIIVSWLIQSVKQFKVTYWFIFSNLSKYFKRFAAWFK